MRPVTEQQKTLSSLALGGFFFIVKTLTAALLVLLAVLVVSQSAVAPVSARGSSRSHQAGIRSTA